MNRLVICLTCAVLLTACHSSVYQLKEAEKISKNVASQYIPDSREDIYRINFVDWGSSLVASGETTSPEAKQALLSQLKSSSIQVTDSITILPDQTPGAKNWALVNISVCNIRSNPANSAEMATQAIMGTPVRILKKSGGWFLIQTPDRYIGWVDDEALLVTDSTGMVNWRSGKRIIYLPLSGTGFNPETKEAVTDLVAGSILKLGETSKLGCIAEMPDGRRIELSSTDITDFDTWRKNTNPSAESLAACAKSLMGRPYLWGGTSSKGVDCSGFVKTVYFLNGIILARDASLQFRHGLMTEPISGYTSLKPGDLVFFGKKANGDKPAKATHVGMYLGNGAYINSSGYVRTDSFDPAQKNYSKVRADNWLGGRTIMGSEGNKGIVRVKDHPWY
ncbi:MAG: C40 family peptidase [Prolixibacteraceae bacterium]